MTTNPFGGGACSKVLKRRSKVGLRRSNDRLVVATRSFDDVPAPRPPPAHTLLPCVCNTTDWFGRTSLHGERSERRRGDAGVVQGGEERRGVLLSQGRDGEQVRRLVLRAGPGRRCS